MALCFWFPLLCMQIYTDLRKDVWIHVVFTRGANLPHDNGRVCASDCSPVAGDELLPPGQIPSTASRTKEFGSRKSAPSQCVPQITGTELQAWRLCCRGLIFFCKSTIQCSWPQPCATKTCRRLIRVAWGESYQCYFRSRHFLIGFS